MIGDQAFNYNQLDTVYIPDSVVSVGYLAFYRNNMQNPGDVSIGANTTYIEGSSFPWRCTVDNGCIVIRP